MQIFGVRIDSTYMQLNFLIDGDQTTGILSVIFKYLFFFSEREGGGGGYFCILKYIAYMYYRKVWKFNKWTKCSDKYA